MRAEELFKGGRRKEEYFRWEGSACVKGPEKERSTYNM